MTTREFFILDAPLFYVASPTLIVAPGITNLQIHVGGESVRVRLGSQTSTPRLFLSHNLPEASSSASPWDPPIPACPALGFQFAHSYAQFVSRFLDIKHQTHNTEY